MKKSFITSLLVTTINAFAQSPDLGKGIYGGIMMQGTFSDGTNAPFWLTANEYGLPSIENNSGFLRGAVFRSAQEDHHKRHWDIGYGADLVVPVNHTSDFFVQQLYADVRWFKGMLTIGQKEQPLQLKNNSLSSGSQTFGRNARPYPEIRLALPNYWEIPGTKGFLSFKGHIAFGMFTDNHFQKDFTNGTGSYDQNVLMHTKAGYLKFGKKEKPFSVEAGLEMASQFGSTHYEIHNGTYTKIKNGRDLKSFWYAFKGGGADATDGTVQNNEGNMLGSWVLRLNYNTPKATYGLYADHFFEDHSAMFHINYDGYAYEDGHMKKKSNRFRFYPLRDIMLGGDVRLKQCDWLSEAVVEYIYTKYQSGPVYIDRTPEMPNQIAGVDNYYNNGIEPGWQHWGQTLGNPLYLSPIYNTNGNLDFQCNRFVAWHVGIAGYPTRNLHYNLHASWQEGLGTYDRPYPNPKHNVSVGIAADLKCDHLYHGLKIGVALGFDRGGLMGNNTGGSIAIGIVR
ncbi:MAG: hypothetical protein IJ693_09525 [Bacteroidaceae bacterium]|nr:hypothetical protein [Bacteroidaceae bacterium]